MTKSERSTGVFNVEKIREFVELMQEYDLSELNLRHDESQIQLKRGPAEAPTVAIPAAPRAAPPPAAAPAAESAPAAEQSEGENIVVVTSPMVGTFYSKPNPEANDFVKIGDRVTAETTICIIEAMKVFNEIPADTAGTIVAILVDNEEPVEFGKPLFKIDTAK